tara:strand:- start:4127 stop:6454 length:2328 start_codon:yes stop_codon:yes gene_type:complete
MNRVVAFLSLFVTTIFLFGQSEDEAQIHQFLLENINHFRQEQGLKILEQAELLDAVAFEQASYLSENQKLTHEQEQGNKKTLQDRLNYFEAPYASAGENIIQIPLNSKQYVVKGKEKVVINTNQLIVEAALFDWLDEEESQLNLIEPAFEQIGISVIKNETDFYLVVVMATLPYENPGVKKLPFNFHGIAPFKKEVCGPFIEKHGSLPQLFSDAFVVKGNEVYFEFHNLAYFEEVFSDGGDGIAIDLVSRNQYSCEEGNRLFPGDFSNGLLLKPAKKMKLLNANEGIEQGKVKVSIADLPAFYNSKDYEINGVLIKDGHACERVPFNQIKTKNLSQIANNYLLQGDSLKGEFAWEDTLNFVIPLDSKQTQKEAWEKVKSKLAQFNFEILAYEGFEEISPQAKPELSEKLDSIVFLQLNPFLQQMELQAIERKVAWESYKQFQKNSFYQIETQGMDEKEVANYLEETAATDSELKAFLSSTHQLQLKLMGKAKVTEETSEESLIESFKSLMSLGNIAAAAAIQKYLIEKVEDKSIVANAIPKLDPSQKKQNLAVINNQMVLEAEEGALVYEGNLIHKAALELHLVDKTNAVVNFNYHLSTLNYWAKHPDKIKDVEQWLDGFEKLNVAADIPTKNYARAMLQYYLIAANFHYEKDDFVERKKDFEAILKWKAKAELEDNELLDLAKYLCHQDQFPKAILLLKKKVQEVDTNAEILSYYLQIVRYGEEEFNQKEYMELMEKFASSHPQKFCHFFSKEVNGIQALEDNQLKSIYCKSCQ